MKDDILVIVPEEAKIVKIIFDDYLSGMSKNAIIKKLISQGYTGKRGGQWDVCDITTILTNEKYVGDMLLQKTYNSNHIEKRKQKNKGQLPRYYITESHEPIVTRDEFERVQEMVLKKKAHYRTAKNPPENKLFSGKITCGQCGKAYRYKVSNAGTKYEKPVWICPTFNTLGKKYCPSQQVPEDILINVTNEVLGIKVFDKTILDERIKEIRIPEPNKLVFVFWDNQTIEKAWLNKSRKESWTEEKKQMVRQQRFEYKKRG